MKVSGIRHIQEKVDVYVSTTEMMTSIRSALKQSGLYDFDYIENGNCMVFDFTNGHTGDDEYKILRKATALDKKVVEVVNLIEIALKNADVVTEIHQRIKDL